MGHKLIHKSLKKKTFRKRIILEKYCVFSKYNNLISNLPCIICIHRFHHVLQSTTDHVRPPAKPIVSYLFWNDIGAVLHNICDVYSTSSLWNDDVRRNETGQFKI